VKDFRDLIVWQKAMNLFEDVVKDAEKFPNTEVARIISNQVLRSISSISANIAEGFGRRRGKEYEHYLYISRGSANESIDWYEKLKRLNYISIDTRISELRVEEQRTLETVHIALHFCNTLQFR
jgi:four helix bundle protein